MRCLVTIAVLSGILCAFAQTDAPISSVPETTATPQIQTPASRRSLFQRQRIGRTAPLAATAGPAGGASASDVPASTPVISLAGVCSNPQAKTPCRRVITREDFDRFVNMFSPKATGQVRGRLAVQYARTLAYSALAQQAGFDKDPAIAKELAAQEDLLRARVLATALLQMLQEKTTALTEVEVAKYYEAHRDEYEQVQVRRLSVPFEVPTESGHPLTPSAIRPYMEELRKRAVAGEDFNALQQDAYKYFHIQTTPSPVNITTLQRRTTQGDEAKALDLKPGEISEVLDSFAALVIIRVESKEPMPLAAVRQEIEVTLRGAQMQNHLSSLTKNVTTEFNLKYFDMPSQPDIFGSAVSAQAMRATVQPSSIAVPRQAGKQ